MIKIQTATDPPYHFNIRTKSGANLLSSITFADKRKMDETIKNLMAIPVTRNHFERNTNTEGKFLFSLKDDEGRTIGHSEPYDSEAGMENGIKNLRENLR